MEFGLLGGALSHSYSEQIHALLGGYDYRLYPVTEAELERILRERAFRGLNVTIPYKKIVPGLCDEVSDTVRRIGSANTLVVRDGRLFAYNTDVAGCRYMLERAGARAEGRLCVVLGSGGASAAAVAALENMGAGKIVVVSRRGEVHYGNLYDLCADAELLINATPVGMYPHAGERLVDLSRLPRLRWVADMIYNPCRTRLLMDAEARGIACAGGLWMLVEQARLSAELFTGASVPQSRTEEICECIRSECENVVLIGMPGCGKTTAGQRLAQRTGRRFFDSDAEIEKAAGMSCAEIITARGEAEFRRLEAEVLRRLGQESGCVIATGGGCVKTAENYDSLHQNGIIVHVKRPLSELETRDRPLSADPEALARERMPLYEAWADAQADSRDILEGRIVW